MVGSAVHASLKSSFASAQTIGAVFSRGVSLRDAETLLALGANVLAPSTANG
jgi:hypothetical protein